MSLRRKPTPVSSPNHVEEINKTIEQARLAQDSFFQSVGKGSADIAAPLTPAQKQYETGSPFKIEVEQSMDASTANVVIIRIKLSNGWFMGLRPLSSTITKVFAPLFTGSGFSVEDGGTVNKVCSNPSASYTTWAFTKAVTPEVAAKLQTPDNKDWVLPKDTPDFDKVLRSLFGIADLDPRTDLLGALDGQGYKFKPDNFNLQAPRTAYTLIPQ